MFEAVLSISRQLLKTGRYRQNDRFIAFANLIIGETLVNEYSDDMELVEDAQDHL